MVVANFDILSKADELTHSVEAAYVWTLEIARPRLEESKLDPGWIGTAYSANSTQHSQCQLFGIRDQHTHTTPHGPLIIPRCSLILGVRLRNQHHNAVLLSSFLSPILSNTIILCSFLIHRILEA